MDRDELVRAGLYDPAAPDSGERLELLEYLVAEGLTIEEMAEADREGRLTVAAVERMLRGGTEQLTLAGGVPASRRRHGDRPAHVVGRRLSRSRRRPDIQ
jgi:hypothetical protein